MNTPLYNSLRYGENPHQEASIYGKPDKFIDCFHGKELSYNNYLDIDSALRLHEDFNRSDPTCAIFKHTIPCGVASASTLKEAYLKAFSTDKKSLPLEELFFVMLPWIWTQQRRSILFLQK